MASEPQPETAVTPSPAPTTAAAPAPAAEETAITLPRGPGAVATDAAQSVPMTDDEAAPAWLTKADWLLLGLLTVVAFVIGASPALNPDTWMHLATGRLIAHGDYLPGGAEPFSVATEARDGHAAVPWINHSWLFALGLYVVYSVTGPIGVVILKALLVAAVTVVLIQVRNRSTNLLVLAVCLTLSVLALGSTRLFLQPVLASYLMLALTLLMLHRAGVFDLGDETDSAPRDVRWLWALPPLCVLWVNLDNWFVLGPLTVALCWAGVAIERWRGLAVRVPVGRVGLVCGASLLACLISPFHVGVFQLPPELAYLVVRAADTVGVDLPNAIAGGGRTVAILHEAARDVGQVDRLTLSPLEEGFLRNPHVGYNVCGICFFPLLILGLGSFMLSGFVAGKPGAPPPQAARFLVWLAFAVLATLMYRMIPFFAVVAGPITALNFGELLAWYAAPSAAGAPPAPWVAPARLIRLLGVPLLIALGLLAWPGWLHGPIEWESPRHVVWDIPVDSSLQTAAERLAALQAGQPGGGKGVRVFGTGMEMNAYCAWFAPGVKGFLDTRFALFPDAIKDYRKARQALGDKSRPASEWSAVLRGHGIGHVVVDRFMTFPPNRPPCLTWWREPARWRQDFADVNVGVFTLAAPGRPWPAGAVLDDWNARAFAAVPATERPPATGLAAAPENRGLFDRYLQPPPHLPEAAIDVDAKVVYGGFVVPRALELAKLCQPATANALASLPVAPGTCSAPWAVALSIGIPMAAATTPLPQQTPVHVREAFTHGLWTKMDLLPPAGPVLGMRRAWQAVADAPANERCYVVLADAIGNALQQEGYWVNPMGAAPPGFRATLRQAQRMAALQSALAIGFSDARLQFQVHRRMYALFMEQYALDLALEQLKLAADALDASVPEEPKALEEWHGMKKGFDAGRQQLETDVKRRLQEFRVKTATHSKQRKLQELLTGTVTRYSKENKAIADPRGWGLTGLTLELLQEVDPKELDQKEQLPHAQVLIDRLFKVGRARQAAKLLEEVQEALGPAALHLQILRAGTQGNYDEMRAALAKLETARDALAQASKNGLLACSAALALPPPLLGNPAFTLSARVGQEVYWTGVFRGWQAVANEHYSYMTLRGIIALEAGDTAAARRIFEQTLRESGGMYFSERPIAQRYADMLAAYQKP